MNDTYFDYEEPHYFDKYHAYRFIGFKDSAEYDYLFMDPDETEEIDQQRINIAYKKGHTINTGELYRYNEIGW